MKEKYDKNYNLIYYENSDKVKFWRKYNKNNRIIYEKDSDNNETLNKYDENDNLIYSKYSPCHFEYWYKYDENDNRIYYKDSHGREYWYKNDYWGKRTEITKQEFKQIERTKLYLNIKRSNRFELMDI